MPASFVSIRPVSVDGVPLPSEPPAADRVHRAVYGILDETPLCSWSTVTASGQAHVNIGYFAHSDDLHLYLLSHPGSLHCRNILANASMAVAVFPSAQNWTDSGRGIQLFGTCAPVGDTDASEADRVYSNRYPAYPEWKARLKAGDPALVYRFYRFVTDRVKILDEAEFGDAVFVVADIART
jgi:uncharacterized protein YhbP (UPF0306 family)